MDEDFSVQGLVSESTVPDLLRSLVRSSETAIVTITTPSHQVELFFTEGRIVYARSSDSDFGLAEVLLREGEISLQQYRDAQEKSPSSRRMGAVLFELGYLKPEDLSRAVEKQVKLIVQNAVQLKDGGFVVDFGRAFDSDVIQLSLSTERLLLDAVGSIEHFSLVERGVQGAGRRFRHTTEADAKIYHLDLSETENYVFSLLQEPVTIEQICERSYLADFETIRTLWALTTANLVTDLPLEGERGEIDFARREMELEGEVERYNSTFQAIFDLVFQRIGDHTYDFVDRVALHVSPEMMPYLSGVNLINEGRVDYDQLLNNLYASGSSDHDRVIRAVLNELLLGWVVEIRREFRGELDAAIEAIVTPLRS